MARRIEQVSGIAAGVLGAAVLLFALFGPTGTQITVETLPDGTRVERRSTTSLWEQQDISLVLVLFLTVMLVSLIGIAVGAWAHASWGSAEGFTLLWISTVALSLGMLLSIFSKGLFFAPSALLAIVACVAGSQRSMRGRPRNRSHA